MCTEFNQIFIKSIFIFTAFYMGEKSIANIRKSYRCNRNSFENEIQRFKNEKQFRFFYEQYNTNARILLYFIVTFMFIFRNIPKIWNFFHCSKFWCPSDGILNGMLVKDTDQKKKIVCTNQKKNCSCIKKSMLGKNHQWYKYW